MTSRLFVHREARASGGTWRSSPTSLNDSEVPPMPRLAVPLLFAVLMLAVATPAGAVPCGDFNGDGVINIVDTVVALNVVSGIPLSITPCGGAGVMACGDLNQDGVF